MLMIKKCLLLMQLVASHHVIHHTVHASTEDASATKVGPAKRVIYSSVINDVWHTVPVLKVLAFAIMDGMETSALLVSLTALKKVFEIGRVAFVLPLISRIIWYTCYLH